jgi:transcriptional repressor NrdR
MHCPYCRNSDTRVLDSRVAEDGASIRRRRTCARCEKRFTTVELMQLTIVKRSGVTEPFNRDKAIAGAKKACKGRPVTDDQLACLGQEVEDALRGSGSAEIPAHEVGLAILRPLRELDEVAYLRFASIERLYTTPGVHPYDEVDLGARDVVQTNWKTGETIFEQRGVEFPDFWSINASTIVTTKYFRGAVGTDRSASGASSSSSTASC